MDNGGTCVKVFFEILWSLFSWFKYPTIMLVALAILFFILIYINVFIGLLQGKRFKKGVRKRVKRPSIFRRLFIDLPKQISLDMFDRNPEAFTYKGLVIFEGIQGSGKSIAMCKYAMDIQEEFEKTKCLSNLHYAGEDKGLKHWKQLIDFENR